MPVINMQLLALVAAVVLLLTTQASAKNFDFDYSSYLNTASEPTEDGAILLLGDSWAAIAGDYAANICGLSETRYVTNDAKSGTTASQWAEKETAVDSVAKWEYDYEYVWLSLGGNDFLDNKCDIDMAEDVAANISSPSSVRSSRTPQTKTSKFSTLVTLSPPPTSVGTGKPPNCSKSRVPPSLTPSNPATTPSTSPQLTFLKCLSSGVPEDCPIRPITTMRFILICWVICTSFRATKSNISLDAVSRKRLE